MTCGGGLHCVCLCVNNMWWCTLFCGVCVWTNVVCSYGRGCYGLSAVGVCCVFSFTHSGDNRILLLLVSVWIAHLKLLAT